MLLIQPHSTVSSSAGVSTSMQCGHQGVEALLTHLLNTYQVPEACMHRHTISVIFITPPMALYSGHILIGMFLLIPVCSVCILFHSVIVASTNTEILNE